MTSNLVSDRGAILVEGGYSDDENPNPATEAMGLRNLTRGIARYHSTSKGIKSHAGRLSGAEKRRAKGQGSDSDDSIVLVGERGGADRLCNVSERFDFWNPRPSNRARSVSPRLFASPSSSSAPRLHSPRGMRTAARSARREELQRQKKPLIAEADEKNSEEDVKPIVRRKPDMAARARLYGQTESTQRKASPPLKPHAGKSAKDSDDDDDDDDSQTKKQKPKMTSTLGTAAGKRLYSMARVQQHNQQEMRERVDALREKEFAKTCTFTPTITSMAKHYAEDVYRAPSERYEILKERQSLNRIDQKVREEERLVKECTFKPSLSRASVEMVRRSRSCDVPREPGQRLYEEKNERRVRQLLKQRLIESESEKQAIGCFQVTQEEADGIVKRLQKWGDMRDKNIDAMREECVRRMRAPHVRSLDPNAVVARLLSPSPEPASACERSGSGAPPTRSGSATNEKRGGSSSGRSASRSSHCEESEKRHAAATVVNCPRISEKSRQIAEELRIIRFGALFYKYAPLGAEDVLFGDIKRQVRDLFPEDAGVIAALSYLYKRDEAYVTKEDFVVCLIMYEQQYGPQRWGRPSRENVLHAFHVCLEAQATDDAAERSVQNRQNTPERVNDEQRKGSTASASVPRVSSAQATPRERWFTPLSSARSLRASNAGGSPNLLSPSKRRTPKAIYVDFAKDAEKRAERRKKLVDEIKQREVEECTFAPKLNTRTVLLSNKNLQRSRPSGTTSRTSSSSVQRPRPETEKETSSNSTRTYVESSPSKERTQIPHELRASLSAIEVSSDSAASSGDHVSRGEDAADKLAEQDLLLAIERELAKCATAALSPRTEPRRGPIGTERKKPTSGATAQLIREGDVNARTSKRVVERSGSSHCSRMSSPATWIPRGKGEDNTSNRVHGASKPSDCRKASEKNPALLFGTYPRFAEEADSIFHEVYGALPFSDQEDHATDTPARSACSTASNHAKKRSGSSLGKHDARNKETLLLATEKPARKRSSSSTRLSHPSRDDALRRDGAAYSKLKEQKSKPRIPHPETQVLVVPKRQSAQRTSYNTGKGGIGHKTASDEFTRRRGEKREDVMSGGQW